MASMKTAIGGSSPRMRGKLSGDGKQRAPRRLIPAHAGKTSFFLTDTPRPTAHPRACGENLVHFVERVHSPGSSPRMRGKPTKGTSRFFFIGLIPAHAGKTAVEAGNPRVTRAHPRACGENGLLCGGLSDGPGSSPRMRGKQDLRIHATPCIGLIPAHAGKTPFHGNGRGSVGAHPRACGENAGSPCRTVSILGSSPRMRGKH